MTILSQEFRDIQNPALGAALIWRFCHGFASSNKYRSGPDFQVAFIVLPMILHLGMEEMIKSTRKDTGLRSFVAKIGESRNSKKDLIFQLQNRVYQWKKISLDAILISVSANLVAIVEEKIISLTATKIRGLPDDIKELMNESEKLGYWCGQLTLFEIMQTLKVYF